MDILHPASFSMTSDMKSMLLFDHSSIQPEDFGHTIKRNTEEIRDTSYNTRPLSGLLLNSVSNQLTQEGFYGKIETNDLLHTRNLKSKRVKTYCDSSKIDLLVSMDRLVLHTRTEIKPLDIFKYRATRDVLVQSVWRVFDVKADTMITAFQYSDSLYWEALSISSDLALQLLPKVEETLPEIGNVIGEKVSGLLGPHWETVNRYYFTTGSRRMKFAVDFIRNNDWDAAASLWREEYKKGFGRSVYRSAMNMMLYYEYMGNPKEALEWSKKVKEAVDKMPLAPMFGFSAFETWLYYTWVEALKVRSIETDMLKVYFNKAENKEITN